ncbi:DNA recombination protein RmuC [Methylobrevis pamukkalensis]|uniref:DNA recombination protein RmuC homolog n=1 Tax=Methylobrevis pamukkalensis TaxID=1439726 RepID=A0A1E3H8A5_9HYPH|nr:DNA recombination protein RmuC [Methylobrevis pamukkalensis]ODN72385.1 DNA recombination protein RmuC [Methylobrevis pamukkalensis]
MSDLLARFRAADPELLLAAALGLGLLILVYGLGRAGRGRALADSEARIGELMRLQSEMTGRMQTMAEIFSTRQGDLARALGERIDGLAHKVGGNMAETTRATGEQLSRLHERMAVIDRAQTVMADLAGEVMELQGILADKQLRGAFGQGRMEAIVADALPLGGYSFQATLSNGTRPDCLVFLPGGAPALAVDAKFPLEAFERRRAARDEESRHTAGIQARRDLAKHVGDIRQRYFIPGETFDTAFLFVPSEAIFADIHEHFADVVDKATRLRVLIVSPSLLMLSIQVVQSVLRDTRMKEQAHLIRTEVSHLLDDVGRLRERCLNLQKHFGQATGDLDQILISSEKISRRGGRIDALGFEDAGRDQGQDRGPDRSQDRGQPVSARAAG